MTLIDTLAAWRLTRLVTQDELTRPLREAVPPGGRLDYLVNCPFCVSVWVGAALASGLVPRPIRTALAISTGVILINEALAVRDTLAFRETLRSTD